MKNLFIALSLLMLFGTIYSCKKDYESIGVPENITHNDLEEVQDLIPKEEVLLKALSKWVATSEAKQWLINKRGGPAKNNRRLDEVLIQEIICSSTGQILVDMYNSIANSQYTQAGISDELSSENKMLALKYDAYFDEFLPRLGEFTPLISDRNRSVSYGEGELFDVRSFLEENRGALILDFKLIQAENTVLYDPSSGSFNIDLDYPFCSDDLFADRLHQFSDPICTGEIPMSIAYEVQKIFYKICGGGLTTNTTVNGIEICNNGIDDDDDGLIDGDDPDCIVNSFSQEICDNGIDDDGDGFIDDEDIDCVNNSICMRDQYLEDNFFHELELGSPSIISALGGNLCQGVISFLDPTPYHNSLSNFQYTYDVGNELFPVEFHTLDGLEEWYDFRIFLHLGNSNGVGTTPPSIPYLFHIWQLVNPPTLTSQVVGSNGGWFSVLLITVESPGITETRPVSLNSVPLFSASDLCGINNWDPSVYGDQIALSIHEVDQCRVQASTGEVTTEATVNNHSASFSINLGLSPGASGGNTGGLLYNNTNSETTSISHSITSTYSTYYSDEVKAGPINYHYCWQDQGTSTQIHNVQFGNYYNLRIAAQICE